MGQHHSLENLDSREQFQVLPAPVRSPIFGEVNILKDVLSFEEFYVKMYDEDGTEEKARRDMIVALWHENLLRVHYVEEKGRHVRVVFDKVENSIVEEIMRRSAKGREPNHFTEPELWYLALSMIGPLSLLQKNGISHGQLSSRCISLNSDGKIRVFDPSTILGAQPGFGKGEPERLEVLIRRRGYYSPLVMENLNEGSIVVSHDQFKSDVFSLGMILLEAATLVDVTHTCYMWSVLRINTKKLQELLALVRLRYSRAFYDLLVELLCLEESQRPDWLSLERRFLVPEPKETKPEPDEISEHLLNPQDLGFEVAESVVVSPSISPKSRLLESVVVPFDEMIIKPCLPKNRSPERKRGSMFFSQPIIEIPPRSNSGVIGATDNGLKSKSATLEQGLLQPQKVTMQGEPSTPRAKEVSPPIQPSPIMLQPPPPSPLLPGAELQRRALTVRNQQAPRLAPLLTESLKASLPTQYPVLYGGYSRSGPVNYNFLQSQYRSPMVINSPLLYRTHLFN